MLWGLRGVLPDRLCQVLQGLQLPVWPAADAPQLQLEVVGAGAASRGVGSEQIGQCTLLKNHWDTGWQACSARPST